MSNVEIRAGRLLNIELFEPESSMNSKGTIFCLHGLGGRAEQWQPLIEAFKTDYRLIVPDMLGHGNSAKPKGNNYYTYYAFYQDLEAIFNRYADKENHNIVIGNSLGGALVEHLTSQYPLKIKKQILICPVFRHPRYHVLNIYYLPAWMINWFRKSLAKIFIKFVFSKYTNQALVNRELIATIDNPTHVIKQAFLGLQHLPKLDLTKLQTPTLVIMGDEDGLTPEAHIRKHYSNVPLVQLKTIRRSGHLPMLEQSQEVNQIIRDFIEQ